MMQNVMPIFVFAALATAIALGMWLVGVLVGPRRRHPVKQMPYESGMDPIHDARRRFDVRFHLVAVAFLLFDVEIVFLYPWAVAAGSGSGFSLPGAPASYPWLVFGEVLVFLALLAAAYVYAWRKGLFRWP
jgi:NADH-quinone oxidoreductase subunit A